MTHYAGLNVAERDHDLHRGRAGMPPLARQGADRPRALTQILRQHGCNLQIGVETSPLMPWLVHELRRHGLEVICLDARHAKAALAIQFNKNDRNDAEGMAQIVRTGWYRSVLRVGSNARASDPKVDSTFPHDALMHKQNHISRS